MTEHLPLLILGALMVALTLCNELDVLTLGEDTAQSLGLSVKHIRTLFLLLAALLAGASVSFAGLLGFVGLLVPHVARRLFCHTLRPGCPTAVCSLRATGGYSSGSDRRSCIPVTAAEGERRTPECLK